MDQLIPVLSKLQDVFAALGTFASASSAGGALDLPQIVVVGSQSSGKSSVLEKIVGRDFLPRGTGIVTRRPLLLHLSNSGTRDDSAGGGRGDRDGCTESKDDVTRSVADPSGDPTEGGNQQSGSSHKKETQKQQWQQGDHKAGQDRDVDLTTTNDSTQGGEARGEASGERGQPGDTWAEFSHLPGVIFRDFDAVKAEIQAETNRLVGSNKNISAKPIKLHVHAPDVVNLTLVDLPGITKNPIGDQPSDIEEVVRSMVLDYISQPRAIILAISEATNDLANSEALKLARQVDKKGERTIGVVTKLDLMDAGTDAVDILMNRVIPLERGYIGVVNRSQQDINDGVTIAEAHEHEAAYFRRHPAYRHMSGRMGSKFLARMLNQVLLQHARECLPSLKARIGSMLSEIQAELSELGDPVSGLNMRVKGELLLMLLSKYATAFTTTVDGTSDEVVAGVGGHVVDHMGVGRRGSPDEMDTVLAGGARIAFVFNDVFTRAMMSIHPFDEDGLSEAQIMTAIHNAAGTRPPLFVPQVAFELLVKHQIRRLKEPAMRCVDLVYNELMRIAACCESDELARFTVLRNAVLNVVHELLAKTLAPTHTMVTNLIEIELAHINTSHPDFIGGSRAVAELLQRLDNEEARAHPTGTFSSTFATTAPHGTFPHSSPATAAASATATTTAIGGAAPGATTAAASQSTAHLPSDVVAALGTSSAAQALPPLEHPSATAGGSLGASFVPSIPGSASRSTPLKGLQATGVLVASDSASASASSAAAAAAAGAAPSIATRLGGGSINGDASDASASAVGGNPVAPPATPQAGRGASSWRGNPHPVTAFRVPGTIHIPAASGDTDKMACAIIKSLILSYFNIVRKSILDMVPKTIMCFLVNCTKENVRDELIRNLYRDESQYPRLLCEHPQVQAKREACVEMHTLLARAMGIVDEVRGFTVVP